MYLRKNSLPCGSISLKRFHDENQFHVIFKTCILKKKYVNVFSIQLVNVQFNELK